MSTERRSRTRSPRQVPVWLLVLFDAYGLIDIVAWKTASPAVGEQLSIHYDGSQHMVESVSDNQSNLRQVGYKFGTSMRYRAIEEEKLRRKEASDDASGGLLAVSVAPATLSKNQPALSSGTASAITTKRRQPANAQATAAKILKRAAERSNSAAASATLVRLVEPSSYQQRPISQTSAAVAKDPWTKEMMDNSRLDRVLESVDEIITFNQARRDDGNIMHSLIAERLKSIDDRMQRMEEMLEKKLGDMNARLEFLELQVVPSHRHSPPGEAADCNPRPTPTHEVSSTLCSDRAASTPRLCAAAASSTQSQSATTPTTQRILQTAAKAAAISDIDDRCNTMAKHNRFDEHQSPVDFSEPLNPDLLHRLRVKSGSAKYFAKLLSRLSVPGFVRFKLTVGNVRADGKMPYSKHIFDAIVELTVAQFPGTTREAVADSINLEARQLLSDVRECRAKRRCRFCRC